MSSQKHGNPNQSEPENPSPSALVDFHALSNALEVILQTSYLISTTCTDEKSKKWITMLNDSVDRAIKAHRSLRQYLPLPDNKK
jgi:hypothetical protein